MGIAGLLPLLKKASKNSHVRKFSGCTAAIDAYGWLHKGAFGCAEKLGKGEPTTAYITYCMKYIQVLLDNKIKPILVLDGRNLPSKEHTEKKRRQKRDENKKLARKYLQEGKRKEAWECFTKCVDITPAMAREFIKVLRSMKIDYVVAPYEADAQLAYLAVTGVADIIITEDSDLILFGCPRIFFKMNVNGDGVFFEASKLPQCLGLTPSKFKFDKFRWMCILSGCDYLPSLPGIGLGRAKKVILESQHNEIREMILSIPSILVKVQVDVTEDYIDAFIQAENTFLYQLVFDTRKRMLLPLNPYPEGLEPKDLPFAGSYDTKKIAIDLALGNVDLHTLKTVDCFEPLQSGYTATSIWSSTFESGKKDYLSSDSKTGEAIGMQIAVSTGANLKKKRPLAVINSDNEDNDLDDNELMKMYEETKMTTSECRGKDNFEFEDKESVKLSVIKEEGNSPVAVKRRRITDQNAEETRDNSPCRNTRSRNRVLPFLKSPDSGTKVHVKSKYFKSEVDVISCSSKTQVIDIKQEEEDEDGDLSEEDTPDSLPNLNIYSYESSSQDSIYSDISVSQRASEKLTPNNSDKSATLAGIRPCSVVIEKTDIPEIILDGGSEEDDAYESATSRCLSDSQEKFTPPFPSALSTRSAVKTPLLKTTKSTFRRQGLSRSAKKDPKQPSVRDMFTRHKSVQ